MEQYIHPHALLGNDVTIGRFTVIEEDVVIGDGCRIGHHVIIHKSSKIGSNVRIDDNAVIGKFPMAAARSETTDAKQKLDPAVIEDNTIIGTGAIIYAGSIIGQKALIADSASIRENVTIGEYSIIGRNASIENKVTIGKRCKIQTNAYICAYSEIGDDCFIAPCVATSNDNYVGRWKERSKYFKGVTVKNGGRIAVNATVLPGKVIQRDSLVAAGSVVTKDVPESIIVCGNPAQKLREVPENQLLKNQED